MEDCAKSCVPGDGEIDTVGDQLRMAGIHRRRRDAEGKLDRSRSGDRLAVVANRPHASGAQRQQGRTDAEADPMLTVDLDRKPHDVAVERPRFIHLAAQQDGMVEVGDSTQAHGLSSQ